MSSIEQQEYELHNSGSIYDQRTFCNPLQLQICQDPSDMWMQLTKDWQLDIRGVTEDGVVNFVLVDLAILVQLEL